MMIRAMVVGIGRYEQAGWNVDGPLAAAFDVARWLLALTDVTPQITLFIDADASLPDDLAAAAEAVRLDVRRETTARELNRFAREGLPDGAPSGSQLFFFWSGHGVTCNTTGDRIFACGDYKDGRPDVFFNVSNFLMLLRTSAFGAFANQIVLGDTCAVYRCQISVTFETHNPVDRPQLARFAAEIGKTVRTADAGGTFVKAVLDVLRKTPGYPLDLEKLKSDFDAAHIDADTQTRAASGGVGVETARAALFETARTLLDSLDARALFAHHYERTVADLGLPAGACDLASALKDLCEMRDGQGAVPHGLMQFMMRLALVPKLSAPIEAWLDTEAKNQPHSRQEIADKLALEGQQRLLLVVVWQKDGEIAGLRPYLCCVDASFDQAHPFDERQVWGWKAFETAMGQVLVEVATHFPLDEMQIQFVIDRPLLDRPFHRLATPEGGLLGQRACVVLRDRGRVFSPNQRILKKWAKYASALRGQNPAAVRWLRIDDGAVIPEEEGFCFAGFSVPHPVEGVSPGRSKEVLGRVLSLGTPFLYVRHEVPPTPGAWDDVAAGLQTLSAKLDNIEDFVGEFHDARLRGIEDAQQASLIWDDPSFNPFKNLHRT